MKALDYQAKSLKSISRISSEKRKGPHVSIYLPLRSRQTRGIRQTMIQQRIAEAKVLLSEDLLPHECDEFLTEILTLGEHVKIPELCKGIAFFKSNEDFYYSLLALEPVELTVVADSFHIKPLVNCFAMRANCYIIMATTEQVSLLKLSGTDVEFLETMHQSPEDNQDKRSGFVGQRKRHKDVVDGFIKDSLKKIHKAYNLRHHRLAILGPQRLRAKIKSELTEGIQKQIFFESLLYSSLSEMVGKLAPALSKELEESAQKKAVSLLKEPGKGLITTSLEDIAKAAIESRIEQLVVDPKTQVWGRYDREKGLLETSERQQSHLDDCVIDDIVEEVLRRDGEVIFFNADIAESKDLYLATLRW
ncbi:MAG: hypothetical protein HRU19_26885 [Pseudobacteriovorax sp.]|nr:hypothetical protein [Pseudobacteriovorax sp.]